MPNTREISFPLFQGSLIIENEQCHDSANVQSLTNASDDALKHALNVDYQGMANLRRRLGYIDAFHVPVAGYDDHMILNGVAPLLSDHTWGDSSEDTHGIRGLARFTYFDNRAIRNPFNYQEDRYTIFAMRYLSADALQLTCVNIITNPTLGDTITGAVSGATMIVWKSNDNTHPTLANTIIGFYTSPGVIFQVGENISDGAGGTLAPDPAVIAANGVNNDGAFRTATYYWRNPGNPNIRILETPLLDRLVWNLFMPNAFSDANRAGENAQRFWNFATWGLLGETETFLIGTHGGHSEAATVAIAPRAWNCGGGGLEPPAGSFDSPYINPNAIQRRCYVWWNDWYRRWAAANGYNEPTNENEDVGTYNWGLPFVWYHRPYNVAASFMLVAEILNECPAAGATLTQAVTGASMVVHSCVNEFITIGLAALTAGPTNGSILTQLNTGATMLVRGYSVINNTIHGIDLHTGTWSSLPADTITDSGGNLAPTPATVTSTDHNPRIIYGQDQGTGIWNLVPANTVNDGPHPPGVMSPANIVLENFSEINHDQFYAEPCGAFLEEYHECLFMAKIERTVLVGAGYQKIGTPTRVFNPNEVMYSFPGYASALQMGSSRTPPQYPFAIASEPWERPWGCSDPSGYFLNRIAYAEPRGVGTIVGLKKWNETLYIMKPQGFTAVYGNHPTNFSFINLGMSQGPCGRFAWVKTDEGIYYVTKNGLFLFRGNAADAMIPLSDKKVAKIFDEDIDWMSATDFITGELLGISVGWDKQKSQIIISYPKKGEQGGNGQPFGGCPTRQLVYDTVGGRFTEWCYKMPAGGGIEPVGIGIMKGGEDPTDDDYFMVTHPTGNADGNNTGRLLFQGNVGHLDADTLDNTGTPELVGNLIPFYASTKDMTLGTLTPKQTITRHRSVIYATNGVIHQRVTYNYHDVNDERDLVYQTGDENNFIQTTVQRDKTVKVKGASREKGFSTVSFTYYNEQETPSQKPANDNPSTAIQFVAHSAVVIFNEEGDIS